MSKKVTTAYTKKDAQIQARVKTLCALIEPQVKVQQAR